MMTLLIALPLLTAQPILDSTSAPVYRLEIQCYQGDPSNPSAPRETICRPQLLTREKQRAVISICQQVPLMDTDHAVVNDQEESQLAYLTPTGLTISLTPHSVRDGTIRLTGSIKAVEITSASTPIQQKIERDVRVVLTCQPGKSVTVPLYNPSDYTEQKTIPGVEGKIIAVKPFTGKERWVEIKVIPQEPPQ